MALQRALWAICLFLNVLDTLRALKRPKTRAGRKPAQQQPTRTGAHILGNDAASTGLAGAAPGNEVAEWQPAKRLTTLKREQWRSILQNWITWVVFTQVEPFVDQSIGLVMPFYGYIKLLFLSYLCVTRSSGGTTLYRLFILPRLARHSKTIDLTASFLILVAEWLFQITLMMVVLPFVATWGWLKSLRTKLGNLQARDSFGRVRMGTKRLLVRLRFWQWRWRWWIRPDTISEAVVQASKEIDGNIQIEVTSTTTAIETDESEPPDTATSSLESSAAASVRNLKPRNSLLPSSNEITAYTLSSPQTLRRAVDQAREIYRDLDSRRRDVGKKRGEGEVVKGLMKQRMKEMEEQRGKGKSVPGTAKPVQGVDTGAKATSNSAFPPTKPAIRNAQAGPSRLAVAPVRNAGQAKGLIDKPAVRSTSQQSKSIPARARTRTAASTAAIEPLASAATDNGVLPQRDIASVSGNGRHSSTLPLGNTTTSALGSNQNAMGSGNLPGATQVALASPAYPSLTRLSQGNSGLSSALDTRYLTSDGSIGLGFGGVADGNYAQTPTSSYPTSFCQTPFFPGGYPSTSFDSPITPRIAGQYVPFSLTPHPVQPPSIATHLVNGTVVAPAVVSAPETVSSRYLQPANDVSPQKSGESSSAAPARPQLRKNNSLGLIGTLDAMRSPSLEPTNMHTSSQGLSPFFESPRAFPSRLRQDMTTLFGGDRRHARPSTDIPETTDENAVQLMQGVLRPVLPLPAITPLTSPSIPQREASSARRRPRKASSGDIRLIDDAQIIADNHQAIGIPPTANERQGERILSSPRSRDLEKDSATDVSTKVAFTGATQTGLEGVPTRPSGSTVKRATRAVRPTARPKMEAAPRVVAPKVTRSSASKASATGRSAGKTIEPLSTLVARRKARLESATATTTANSPNTDATAIDAPGSLPPSIDIPAATPSRKRKIAHVDEATKLSTNTGLPAQIPTGAQRAIRPTKPVTQGKVTADRMNVNVTASPAKKRKVESQMALPSQSRSTLTTHTAARRSLRARGSKE